MELKEIYQALSGLDCAVTRGWPQALVPLPSLAFSGCEDSLSPDGTRRFSVEILARAASPEGADTLAGGVCDVMAALGLRRVYMKDGAEKDRDTFTKLMRFELLSGGPMGESLTLDFGERSYAGRVCSRAGERRLHDLRTLSETAARPAPGPAGPQLLSLLLPREALADVLAAFERGQPLGAGGERLLPLGYELGEKGLRMDLCRLGEGA